MAEMTGGQALIRSLKREGVEVIFGLPGVQMYEAVDPLYDESEIKFFTTRHEQATTYMADGYARASGKFGTAMVVPGPGLLNASAGIGTAYAASSPILVVAGQINRDKIGKDVGMLHEVNDQLETIKPITKWQKRILDPKEIPGAIHEAVHQLSIGRPRPVEIEIPPETLAEKADIVLWEPEQYARLSASEQQIQRAAEALSKAKHPVLWVGGGAVSADASAELATLAEKYNMPVITTPEGKGAIPDSHPLHLGVISARRPEDPVRDYFKASDVIVAVGTRFADAPVEKSQKVIQIDIDPQEIGRNHDNTLEVLGDARRSMANLAALHQGVQDNNVLKSVSEIRAQRAIFAQETQPQGGFVKAIRDALPVNGILVPDMTQIGYFARMYFPAYEPRTYLTSSYFGNLGFAFPTALGAKVACPDKPVVSVSGDGGFLFNAQELATAKMYNIGVVAVVFSDSAYGNVMRDQITRFEGRVVGSQLQNPDFAKMADAYGVTGLTVHTPDELRSAISKCLDADAPAVIQVPVGMMPHPI